MATRIIYTFEKNQIIRNFKKSISLVFACALFFGLTSCGTMKVFIAPNSDFTKSTPITIDRLKDDASGTLGELQYLLQTNGYKVMSFLTAKKTYNLDSYSDGRFPMENCPQPYP